MNKNFYIKNRQALLDKTGARLVIIAGNRQIQSSNDAAYYFQQEANFWYLTGIDAADWWLILQQDKSYLVAPDVDEVHEVFDGSLSHGEVKNISGIDEIISSKEGEIFLADLLATHPIVYTIGDDPHKDHYDFSLNPGPVAIHEKLQRLFTNVIDCRKDLAQLRAIKQPQEITAIRAAIDLTIDAFEDFKNHLEEYTHEYQVEAGFSHFFRYSGATGHAYDPIVASGAHACTLHYGKNNDRLDSNDMILLDIGARYHGYAADITRTYSLSVPSDRQRAVHNAVETAHKKIIKLLGPGVSVKQYMSDVDGIMRHALETLGLLQSESDYRKYFPHSISHGLGLDVHDSLGSPTTFQEGMVLTVEPGIYIPEESIGVRIEDDILITASGYENLSAKLPTSL
ncbi:aminopeptidase P family protein [Candidatus Saccharibacteria bacterium]|nr:aminopeptidase P family protein [Candidatus Saccharibacteria bacterium]